MSSLLLDTHAWIWYAAGNSRIKRHVPALDRARAAGTLLLSSISIYEAASIGVETDLGRRAGIRALTVRPTLRAWIEEARAGTGVSVLDVEPEHALEAAMLTALHPDPFDRLIVATALSAGAKLATADEKVIAFAKRAKLPVLTL